MISPYVLPGLSEQVLPAHEGVLEEILKRCCHLMRVNLSDVASQSRRRALCVARQLYCWKAKTTTSHTLHRIASLIGRDHASVVYSYYQAMRLIETRNHEFMEALERL